MAQQILTQFEEHPDAWTKVPDILERSSFPQAKVTLQSLFFALHHSEIVPVYWSSNTREVNINSMEDSA